MTTALAVLFVQYTHAQNKGTLAGKVIDANTGEEIIGATVFIEGTNTGTSTDLDGKFFMKLDPGKYNVLVSYVGYVTRKFEGIEIKSGELNNFNVSLKESRQELEEVVIQAEVKKETAAGLILQQKNAVQVSSGVSAELIRKLPDRTTADVVKRISGATIQDGKYAIIRGMQDRYNFGMINGAPLPSSEPDRKAFSLDLVPAQVMDNMLIFKTATPDKPGDFAGGIIQITTRDIPDEDKVFINVGAGYHSITTFREFLKSPEAGGTDFLGYDNSRRVLPKGLISSEDYLRASQNRGFNTLIEQTKLFKNDFTPQRTSALPNFAGQIGFSKRAKIAGNDFGVIAAVTYNNTNLFEPYERVSPVIGDRLSYVRTDSTQGYFYNYDRYRNTVNLGGLLNFAYKVGQNHKFYFKNLYTLVANDQAILRDGRNYNVNLPVAYVRDFDVAYFYQSNRSIFSQLGGEHVMAPNGRLKVSYVLGLFDLAMNVPDFKRNFSRAEGNSRIEADTSTNYFLNGVPTSPGSPNNPGRFFYNLNERGVSANAEVSYQVAPIRTTIKLGGMAQQRKREFVGRNFNLTNAQLDNPFLFRGTISLSDTQSVYNVFNAPQRIDSTQFYQIETTQESDRYTASSNLMAGFVMFETKFLSNFRAIYGIRIESFNQKLSSRSLGQPVEVDTTWIDPLPSINLIYSLSEKHILRASYSRTVSRPEFREFAPLSFYDFTRNAVFVGNPLLTRAIIDNLDIKYEFYFGRGSMFSVNPFAKFFNNPVEANIQPSQGGIAQLSYQNANSAYNYGLEFDTRIDFSGIEGINKTQVLKNIILFGNAAYILSRVDQSNLQVADDIKIRPLQGQSPYVYNFGLQYNLENGFNATVAFNRYGRRINFIAQELKFLVWENPRSVIDVSVSKNWKNGLNARFTIGDILAQDLILYYDLNDSKSFNRGDEIFERYRRGFTAAFNVGYTF